MRNPQSLGCHRGSERFAQSNRFDLELIGVLPISYQLSLAHVVLRSSDVISYLMYVKPWQGQCFAHSDLDSLNCHPLTQMAPPFIESALVAVELSFHAPFEFVHLSRSARLAGSTVLHSA